MSEVKRCPQCGELRYGRGTGAHVETGKGECATESRPMKPGELGRYVCVPASECLHSPHITINTDGVWVKTGQQWSSAHRDCFEARQARES